MTKNEDRINKLFKELVPDTGKADSLAWLMARHADPANVPDSPEEFLDQFNTFSIYQILPQLIELWGLNVQTEVESRKNLERVSGK